MIKTTREKIFGNKEYTLVTSIFKTGDNNTVESITLEHCGKEIMQYVIGSNTRHQFFNIVTILTKHPDPKKAPCVTTITPILRKWKRKYEYDFEGINFPDEESLCLFMMELAGDI